VTSARITFLGTGEAFDAQVGNTSLYIRTAAISYLVDCGFTVPHTLWRVNADPNLLDVIYLTHFHGDHAFGLPALLLRMKEDGRSKPLAVLGQTGVKTFVERLQNFAYAGSFKDLGFPVNAIEVSPNKEQRLGPHTLTFHPTKHVVTNLALRLSFGDFSLFVSGDGELTPESIEALRSSRYAVQECFSVTSERKFHNTFPALCDVLAEGTPRPTRTFLVHASRTERERLEEAAGAAGRSFVVPKDLQMYDLD
jgi:ribonuclease BN (tRNA processing enzyme)